MLDDSGTMKCCVRWMNAFLNIGLSVGALWNSFLRLPDLTPIDLFCEAFVKDSVTFLAADTAQFQEM